MGTFIDISVLILFVLFMIFVFGGYHKNKSAQREASREKEDSNEKEERTIE